MIVSTLPRIALAIILASALSAASAQDASKDRAQPNAAERHETGKGILRLLPADAVTEHSIDTPRGNLAYTATAGTLAFYDQSGDQSASVFYTAYVAKNAAPNRPLTFVFNGGPGAASAFLHLGLVGPRILDFGADSHDASRANVRDNPDTWLAFTDLVLIDPIGTGWSRAIKSDDAKHFWSVRSDADAMAKAITSVRCQKQSRGFTKISVRRKLRRHSAPPRSDACCKPTRASRLQASSCCRRCSKAGSRSAMTVRRCTQRCNCRRWPRPSSNASMRLPPTRSPRRKSSR